MRYQTRHLSSSELGEASFLSACQLRAHFTVFQQPGAIWLAGVWQCRRCLSKWKHWLAEPNLSPHTLLRGSTVVSRRALALSWKTRREKFITRLFFFFLTFLYFSILLCRRLQLRFVKTPARRWGHDLTLTQLVLTQRWLGLRSRVSWTVFTETFTCERVTLRNTAVSAVFELHLLQGDCDAAAPTQQRAGVVTATSFCSRNEVVPANRWTSTLRSGEHIRLSLPFVFSLPRGFLLRMSASWAPGWYANAGWQNR